MKFITENIMQYLIGLIIAAQKMKYSIKDFFSKCYQIWKKLWIWSHLLMKTVMENFIFCAFYLISEKGGITDSVNHNFSRTRIDSCNSLPIEKGSIYHNVIIPITSVVNENKNHYYYNIF